MRQITRNYWTKSTLFSQILRKERPKHNFEIEHGKYPTLATTAATGATAANSPPPRETPLRGVISACRRRRTTASLRLNYVSYEKQ